MAVKAECSNQFPHLCPPADPISFYPGAICEEGSITAILAILFFGSIFTVKHLIHRANKRHEGGNITAYAGITQRKNGAFHWLEEAFILPFIPSSVEAFVATVFFCWFMISIPMVTTRYYEKRWATEALVQQGPFNLLSQALGCEGFNTTIGAYSEILPDLHPSNEWLISSFIKHLKNRKPEHERTAEDVYKNRDYFFTLHLTFAVLWLMIGFVQVSILYVFTVVSEFAKIHTSNKTGTTDLLR